jgi:hypothetical protein
VAAGRLERHEERPLLVGDGMGVLVVVEVVQEGFILLVFVGLVEEGVHLVLVGPVEEGFRVSLG